MSQTKTEFHKSGTGEVTARAFVNDPFPSCRHQFFFTDESLSIYASLRVDDLKSVEQVLTNTLTNSTNDRRWHTIFLFEGILICLDQSVPGRLLVTCRQVVVSSGHHEHLASLCFADGLEGVITTGYDEIPARTELAKHGWRLVDWLPKGGRANSARTTATPSIGEIRYVWLISSVYKHSKSRIRCLLLVCV